MKSILYIHDGYLDSEKANIIQVLNMCYAFSNEGVSVKLVLKSSKTSITDIKKYIKSRLGFLPNFKIHILNQKKIFRIEKYIINSEIKKIIKDPNYDYLFLRSPLYIKFGLKHNKKVIFESHNNLLHNRFSFIDYYWKKIIKKYIKNQNFKLFLCISKNLMNYWIDFGLNKNKCNYYHDGFNLEKFNKIRKKSYYRKNLSLPINKTIITYTGSLYNDRNIELIIKLARDFKSYYFCVVGGPNKSKNYFNEISKKNNLKNIKFIGRVVHSKINNYLFASDVLLALWSKDVKTINYCSPLKLFEYMASGKNILTQNHITILEVVNSKTAYIYDYDSYFDMKSKLLEAVKDNKMKVGLNAKKEAEKKYSWESRVKNIIKFTIG